MAIKLTPTRRRHLEMVRDHHIDRWLGWGGRDSWHPQSLHIRPSTIGWLLDNGMICIERVGVNWSGPFRAVLTDAGREALEAGE